jgi:hypothetical protein
MLGAYSVTVGVTTIATSDVTVAVGSVIAVPRMQEQYIKNLLGALSSRDEGTEHDVDFIVELDE